MPPSFSSSTQRSLSKQSVHVTVSSMSSNPYGWVIWRKHFPSKYSKRTATMTQSPESLSTGIRVTFFFTTPS